MAASQSLLFVSALLAMSSVAAVNVVASQSLALVRRESQGAESMPETQAEVPTECDRQFLEMDEGANTCKGSGHPEEILSEGDCDHAASVLGIKKADNYFMNDYKVNPLPFPKGCFLNTSTNEMYFNPEESKTEGVTLTGKKICMRTVYINGTANTNPDAGCTGDSAAILKYDDCWAAALCAAGGGACKLQDFQDNVTTSKHDDQPQGCFKDALGCWGFNYKGSTPSGTIKGTPVCKNAAPAGSAPTTTTKPAEAGKGGKGS
jgi:hypothetical protein